MSRPRPGGLSRTLTEVDKGKIRQLAKQGVTFKALAERYGVGQDQISRIVNNKPRGGRDWRRSKLATPQ